MGIYSNSPTMTWLSLTGISVVKGEEVFVVKDFKTNLKYIYWDYNDPYQFISTNVLLNKSATRYQVAVNNKGAFIEVPQDEILVSYDGNSEKALSEYIWGLHEKTDEFTNKFVSVEQDIDGIKTTVGQTQGEMGSLKENISKIEQKADSIDLTVKETQKEFNDNKELLQIREDVNISIININSCLGLFKSKLNEYFRDNVISVDEKVEIQANIDVLLSKKSIVFEKMDVVSKLMEGQNKPENIETINKDKEKLETSVSNLITLINTSISDNTIVPTEITNIINAFAKCNTTVNEIKNTLDEFIFLGVGGVISEEIASISMKSDEIKLSVGSLEEQVDRDFESIRNDMDNQINDVNNALDGLEDTMNNSFLDGVLSDSEKISLKKNLDILANEKKDVDSRYSSIYSNSALGGTAKTNLKTSYDNYLAKYSNLVTVINNIINKSDNIVPQDKVNVDTAMGQYRVAIGDFSEKINIAIDYISSNKVNGVDKKYSEILLSPNGIVSKVESVSTTVNEHGTQISTNRSEINQMADKIVSKVDANGVKSIIEQNPDSVNIGFNKINNNIQFSESEMQINSESGKCLTLKHGRLNTYNPSNNDVLGYVGQSYVNLSGVHHHGQVWGSSGNCNYIAIGHDAKYTSDGQLTGQDFVPFVTFVGKGYGNTKDGVYFNWRTEFNHAPLVTGLQLRANPTGSGFESAMLTFDSKKNLLFDGKIVGGNTTPSSISSGGYSIVQGGYGWKITGGSYPGDILTSAWISNSVSSASTTWVASSSAVKTAYDKAMSAYNNANHSHPYYGYGDSATLYKCMPTSHNSSGQYCGSTSQAWNYIVGYNLRYNNYGTNVSYLNKNMDDAEIRNLFKDFTRISENPVMEYKKVEMVNRIDDENTVREYIYNDVFVENENGEMFIEGATMSSYQSKCLEILVNENEELKTKVENLESKIDELTSLVSQLINK